MAAPALSTPFQPYVYQGSGPEASVTAFQIFGVESQVLQIMLRPQEKLLAKPGSVCYTSSSVQAEANVPVENMGGVLQWFLGKSDLPMIFINYGSQDGYIGLAASNLSRILPIDLTIFGGEIICQRDAFLCSINNVTVGAVPAQRTRGGYFGGEVFGTQKLTGQGLAFITAGGSILQKHLAQGEVIVVDVACVLALTSSVDYEVKPSVTLRRALFGVENSFNLRLTGPGVVFIQSSPFQKAAQKIARAVTSAHIRDNPRFLIQAGIFIFLSHVLIIWSLILADQ